MAVRADRILPSAPYALEPGYGGGLRPACFFLLGALASGIVGALSVSGCTTVARDVELWGALAREVPAKFVGSMETHYGLLPRYHGSVSFAGADERPRIEPLELHGLWSFDERAPQRVRFDPADRGRWVFSWAVGEANNRRAAALAVGGVLLLLLLPCCAVLGMRPLRAR